MAYWRIGVFDARTRRDGKPIEYIGSYNPHATKAEEKLTIERERVDYWVGKGAQLTRFRGRPAEDDRRRRQAHRAAPCALRRPPGEAEPCPTPTRRMLRFDILTLFPEVFAPFLGASILGIAAEKGLVGYHLHNIRDYSEDKHHKVDDRPYGGGPGMVMRCEPVFRCYEAVRDDGRAGRPAAAAEPGRAARSTTGWRRS